MKDTVFPVDSVGCFGEEFSWRLLSHYKATAIGGCEEVRWVGLAIAELEKMGSVCRDISRTRIKYLFHVNRSLDLFYVVFYVFLELLKVNGLSDWTSHGVNTKAIEAETEAET